MNPGIEKENNWIALENGQTIGTIGSEGGKIIVDIENINGARITLEKDCGNIPFAITLGVYGLMFHTHFENDINRAKEYIELKKAQINIVFELYDIPEEQRDDNWNQKHDELIDELADMTKSKTENYQKPAANSGFIKWLSSVFFSNGQ